MRDFRRRLACIALSSRSAREADQVVSLRATVLRFVPHKITERKSILNPDITFTTRTVARGDGVRFSAYAVDRGFCAFLLSVDAARSKLGAASAEPQQLLLAFKLNMPRIARAIEARELLSDGSVVVLDARDFN
jgi:hypothetical protein